jgi:hydroxymethylpyrimidine kinase / phosphomethylpyrimidine kinase / thiamine-phosphate diphosphorylase
MREQVESYTLCGDGGLILPRVVWCPIPRWATEHTHGTGCTLSSAVASLLAQGLPLEDAAVLAKAYVSRGIRQARGVGKGPGPVAHTAWPDDNEDMPW